MATRTPAESLYERVLAQLPPHQLHASWNCVLQEELTCVIHSLDDVTSAFVKLGEVRNAVSQLDQSNASTPSLVAAMTSTMGLQQTLKDQVEQIAKGLHTEHVDRKRKSSNDTIPESKRVKSQLGDKTEAPMDHRDATHKELTSVSSSESESSGSSDLESEAGSEEEVGGSEAALKALMKTQQSTSSSAKEELRQPEEKFQEETTVVVVNNSKSAVSRTRLPAVHLKPIVQEVDALPRQERILVTPDILFALKESMVGDVDGKQRCEVIDSLQLVVKWAGEPAGQAQYIALYRDYAVTVNAYAHDIPPSEQTAELERLASELVATLETFSARSSSTCSSGDPALTTNSSIETSGFFTRRVCNIDKMPFSQHRERTLGLLISFKKETSRHIGRTRLTRIRNAAYVVSRWMRDAPRNPELFCLFALIVDAMRKFSVRAPDFVGLTDRMLELVAETPTRKAEKFLANIMKRAVKLLAEVEKIQDNGTTLAEVMSKLEALRNLVKYVTLRWVPQQDSTVRKCAEVLKGHIKKLELVEARRDRCLQALAAIMKDPNSKIPKRKISNQEASKNAESGKKGVRSGCNANGNK